MKLKKSKQKKEDNKIVEQLGVMKSAEAAEEQDGQTQLKSKKKVRKKKEPKIRKSSFLGNMKIAPKLLLGFLIIALLSAGIGVYAVTNLGAVSGVVDYMNDTVILPIRNILTITDKFKEGNVQLRHAVMSDEKSLTGYLSALNAAETECQTTLKMLNNLLSGDALKSYQALQSAFDDYNGLLKDAVAQIKAGNKDQVAADLMSYRALRTAETKVNDAISALRNIITTDAAKQAKASNDMSSGVETITIAGIAIVLALSVLIGALIARGFSQPIKRLTQHVQRLAVGNTDITLAVYPRKDEIGQMREAIGTITKSITALESDTSILINAAMEGDLNVRADAKKHQGIYRDIVDGINATLDATITPIKESTKVLSSLADGNLDVSVSGDFKGDYALIKDALNSTVETVKHYIDEVTDILEHIAQGDMTVSIDSDYKGGFARLKDSINRSIVAFNDVLTEIDTASTQVASGSRQLSDGSQTISQGASEQAAEIDQLTSTVTQISAQATQNAENANDANELVKTAKTDASAGNSQMEKMQQAMGEIKAASMSISRIIKVIDDIAFQTNILALNAAVEAARAGAHGKGFAVVADEVRNLAARSAQAAKETTELIENSITIVGSGTKIADKTAEALESIVSGVDKAADLVAQIASASSEQVIGLRQINASIDQMMRVVQTNSATSEETAAASEELSSQAEMLRDMVTGFQLRGKNERYISREKVKAIGSETTKETIVLSGDDFGKY